MTRDNRKPAPRSSLTNSDFTAAGREHQHFEIEQLAAMRRIPGGHDRIHNQYLASRAQRAVAYLKNPRGRFVIPVVKDVLHDDRVGIRWQFFEEVAAFDSHSAGDAARANVAAAPAATCGRSKSTARIVLWRRRTVASSRPCPSATSISVRTPLKSYASECCSGLSSAD
jgi:hypothetical protein